MQNTTKSNNDVICKNQNRNSSKKCDISQDFLPIFRKSLLILLP